MTSPADEKTIAECLLRAYDEAGSLAPITRDAPDFDVAAAYRVLAILDQRRMAQGWQPVGRKIGFTNTTIWPRYGVFQPMWAHMWSNTVHYAQGNTATLALRSFARPRIEPEVVFRLRDALPGTDDPRVALDCVDWIAPGFEIVQSHFPDWKFTAADCTAAFGLHGALVIGTPVALDDGQRQRMAELLPRFELTLRRDDDVIDRGIGANVLGGPAHALAHLARVLSQQAGAPRLAAGEIVTTGTITDAWPVQPGETWRSDYGVLPLAGLQLSFS